MEPSTAATSDRPRSGRSFKNYSLVIITTAIYFVALYATLYTIEYGHYAAAKWEKIQTLLTSDIVSSEASKLLSDETTSFMQAYSRDPAGSVAESRRRQLEQSIRKVFAQFPALTAINVEIPEGNVIIGIHDERRFRIQNQFSNSLIFSDFERNFKRSYELPPVGNEPAGTGALRFLLTTPLGNPEVEAITNNYRLLALSLVIGYSVIYYFLMRAYLLPVQRVINTMTDQRQGKTALVGKPRSELERHYNDLARDAALTRFSKEMRDRISAGGYSHAGPILEMAPALMAEILSINGAQIVTFSRQKEGAWRLDRVHGGNIPWVESAPFQKKLSDAVAANDPIEKPEFWRGRILPWGVDAIRDKPYFTDIIDATTEHLWLLVVHPRKDAPPTPWRVDFFSRVAQELRFAVLSVEDQRRLILEEKSKANISLSRNLGHDLTNIIATSKLELMTVRTFLSLDPEDIARTPKKQIIFKESLEALLNNTRFLQEVVNLYRSFSYLQKPRFEETNVGDLVRDVVQLYSLSLSKSFKIDTEVAEDLVTVRLEPRLVRLALFNLLVNATDALKLLAADGHREGKILVQARMAAGNKIEVSVADNGPGIRDDSGKLLPQESLNEIFRLGYSTKKKQEGEGLGLNWVQTIVCEFHGGEIIAANREQGGAVLTFRIPVTHTSEAAGISDSSSGKI